MTKSNTIITWNVFISNWNQFLTLYQNWSKYGNKTFLKLFENVWDAITLIYFTAQASLLMKIDQIGYDSICLFSFRFQPLKAPLKKNFIPSYEKSKFNLRCEYNSNFILCWMNHIYSKMKIVIKRHWLFGSFNSQTKIIQY